MTNDEIINEAKNSQSMFNASKKLNIPFSTFKRKALKLNCYKPNQGLLGGHKGEKPFEELKAWTSIRGRLFKERGRKCEDCGWAEVNPFTGIIPVQIDHLDGNKKNNQKKNLRIRCPNCHSLTEHFKFYGRHHKPV